MGYLSCPSRASVCAHLFWRNHPPTTLIFNKDPPPSSSQHDRRRRQSRQHSFSSSPGRAVCCRRRRRKKEGGEEEKKYTVCNAFFLHMCTVSQYLSLIFLCIYCSTVEGRVLSQPPRGSWAPTPLYYHEGGRGRALLDPLLSQGGIFGSLGYRRDPSVV